MALSPIAGGLSATQIAAIQQLRAASRPAAPQAAPEAEKPAAAPQAQASPPAHRGRGQIVNITA